VQIDADKVYPVFAFGRVFVFWAKVETATDGSTSAGATSAPSTVLTVQTKGDTQHVSAVPQPSYVVRVYYSFYNLNKEWAPAQTLGTDTSQIGVTGLRLRVELSEPADDGHQRSSSPAPIRPPGRWSTPSSASPPS